MKARFFFTGVAAVGCLAAVAAMLPRSVGLRPMPPVGAQVQSGAPQDLFTSLWNLPIKQLTVQGFRSAAISSDSAFVSIVSGKGFVSLWRADGKRLWTVRIPHVTRSVVSAGGRFVIAYADLDPTQQSVTILHGSDGTVIAVEPLHAAVWSAALSSDGSQAALVTGNRSLYIYALGPEPIKHIVQLDGIGNSVAFSGDGTALVTGMWDESGVARYDFQGNLMWKYPGPTDARGPFVNRSFEAEMSRSGDSVLGLSYANVRRAAGVLYLWGGDSSGKPMWSHPLVPEAFHPRALISANGRFIAVNYEYRIVHGDQSIIERRLLILDRDGKQTCPEKGGPLIKPVLISIAPDGHRVTISDGQKKLFHINSANGRIATHQEFEHTINQAVPSDDGHFLFVYTGDGTVHFFKLD